MVTRGSFVRRESFGMIPADTIVSPLPRLLPRFAEQSAWIEFIL